MTIQRLEILLFILGWVAAVTSALSNSYVIMDIAFLSLGLTGVSRIAQLVFDRDRYWSMCTVLAGGLMTSYFIGAFVTLMQYDPASPFFTLPGGDAFLGQTLVAILYVSLFFWSLVGLSIVEHRFWETSLLRLNSAAAWRDDEAARRPIMFAFVAMTGLQIFLFVTGQVTLNGVDATENARLPEGLMMVINLADPILAMAAWIIGRWQRPRNMLYVAIATAAWQIVWLGGMGRRNLVYGATLFLVMFIWARGVKNIGRILYLALPIMGVVYFFAKLFLAMRYATYNRAAVGGEQSLMMLYSDAFSLLSTDSDTLSEIEKENYSFRFFILGHLSLTIDQLTFPLAQFGKFLFIAMFNCIPSLLFPEKLSIMSKNNWFGDGKGMLNDLLGMEQLDFAWTPVVTSYADFMWLGPALYPLFFLLLGWAFSRLIQTIRYPSLVIGGIGLCFMEYLSTEAGMSAYILTGRTLVFVWLFAKIVEYFDRPAVTR